MQTIDGSAGTGSAVAYGGCRVGEHAIEPRMSDGVHHEPQAKCKASLLYCCRRAGSSRPQTPSVARSPSGASWREPREECGRAAQRKERDARSGLFLVLLRPRASTIRLLSVRTTCVSQCALLSGCRRRVRLRPQCAVSATTSARSWPWPRRTSAVVLVLLRSARNDLRFLPEQPEQPEQSGNNSAENDRISRVTFSDQRI